MLAREQGYPSALRWASDSNGPGCAGTFGEQAGRVHRDRRHDNTASVRGMTKALRTLFVAEPHRPMRDVPPTSSCRRFEVRAGGEDARLLIPARRPVVARPALKPASARGRGESLISGSLTWDGVSWCSCESQAGDYLMQTNGRSCTARRTWRDPVARRALPSRTHST